jgi:hypothetical protein
MSMRPIIIMDMDFYDHGYCQMGGSETLVIPAAWTPPNHYFVPELEIISPSQ